MSEAPPTFRAPVNIDSPEVKDTLQSQQNAIQDGVLFRTFSCISTVDPQVTHMPVFFSRVHATLQPSVRLSVCLSVRLLNRPSVTLCFLLLLPSHMTSTPAHPSTTYTTMYTDLRVFFVFFFFRN